MILLAVDRDQLRQDWEMFRMPLLIFFGGILGTILAVAQIEYDHLVLDVFHWGSIAVFASFVLYKIYDRYTVSDNSRKNEETEGEAGNATTKN